MATTIDPTGLDRISLACDSDGGLIREGRILRAALECADARVAELEAEVAKLRRERDEARAAEVTRKRERDAAMDVARTARDLRESGFGPASIARLIRASAAGDTPEDALRREMLCAFAEYQQALAAAAEARP